MVVHGEKISSGRVVAARICACQCHLRCTVRRCTSRDDNGADGASGDPARDGPADKAIKSKGRAREADSQCVEQIGRNNMLLLGAEDLLAKAFIYS
jgi:hypothetical protein